MATAPDLSIELHPVGSDARPLSQLLTMFPLAAVVVDPYTHESSWLLDTALRILTVFRGADVRVAFLVTGTDADGASRFLGPLTEEILTLADPDRSMVRSMGLETLPAFVAIRHDGSVLSAAEGWDPDSWRTAASELADLANWSLPEIPAAGDPAPYAGTAALG
ncbi:MAG TPA: hypothetical protein DGF10_06895 [Acidimicrobiaceae bacterium]|nr:hypothetical protein [Acidimicrobiaceae bacterium]HCV34379.1 hypothetical protein [Acidimicrobiaceae bacterium]